MINLPTWWPHPGTDSWSHRLIILNLLCLGLLTALVWWLVERLPPQYPLFYSLPPGREQLASGPAIWQAVGAIATFGILDTILGGLIINKWRILGFIILWSGLLCTLLLGYSLARIYLLVV